MLPLTFFIQVPVGNVSRDSEGGSPAPSPSPPPPFSLPLLVSGHESHFRRLHCCGSGAAVGDCVPPRSASSPPPHTGDSTLRTVSFKVRLLLHLSPAAAPRQTSVPVTGLRVETEAGPARGAALAATTTSPQQIPQQPNFADFSQFQAFAASEQPSSLPEVDKHSEEAQVSVSCRPSNSFIHPIQKCSSNGHLEGHCPTHTALTYKTFNCTLIYIYLTLTSFFTISRLFGTWCDASSW